MYHFTVTDLLRGQVEWNGLLPERSWYRRLVKQQNYVETVRAPRLPDLTPPPSAFRLKIKAGPGPRGTSAFTFCQACVRLGDALESDVPLYDGLGRVSLHHAEIRWVGGRYWIINLASEHTTLLNGQRLAAWQCYDLNEGDCIAVGAYELIFTLTTTRSEETGRPEEPGKHTRQPRLNRSACPS